MGRGTLTATPSRGPAHFFPSPDDPPSGEPQMDPPGDRHLIAADAVAFERRRCLVEPVAIDLDDDPRLRPREIPSLAFDGALRNGDRGGRRLSRSPGTLPPPRSSVMVEPAMCHCSTVLRTGAPRRRLQRVMRSSIGRCSSLISAWSRARSSWRRDAPSLAMSSKTRAGLATRTPWSSTMSSLRERPRPVHHDPVDPIGGSRRDHVRAGQAPSSCPSARPPTGCPTRCAPRRRAAPRSATRAAFAADGRRRRRH